MIEDQRTTGSRWRMLTAAAATLACAGALAACGGDDGDGGGTDTGGGGGGDISIGYASPVASQPNQQDIAAGIEAGAESLGWSVDVLDSNLSADKQVADIETFINQQRQGIAAWTLDPGALNGAYERAAQEEIPVVGLNSAGPNIATDIVWERFTCEPGGPQEETAEYIKERVPDAKVLVVGGPPLPTITAMTECFVKAAEAAGLEVADQQDNVKDTAATATPLVEDMLTKHPDANAIWTYNDTTALGAGAAVVAADKPVWSGDSEGVIILGGNGDKEAIEAIEAGRITGTWDVNPTATGWAVVKALQAGLGEGGDIASMPKQIVVESTLWDKGNVGEYVPQQEREMTLDDLPIVE